MALREGQAVMHGRYAAVVASPPKAGPDGRVMVRLRYTTGPHAGCVSLALEEQVEPIRIRKGG